MLIAQQIKLYTKFEEKFYGFDFGNGSRGINLSPRRFYVIFEGVCHPVSFANIK
jgi:hypothetical protein